MKRRLFALFLALVTVLQPVLPAAAESLEPEAETTAFVTEEAVETAAVPADTVPAPVEATQEVTVSTPEETTIPVAETAGAPEETREATAYEDSLEPLALLGADYQDEALAYHYNVAAKAGDVVVLNPIADLKEDISYQWLWFDPVQKENVPLLAQEGVAEQSAQLQILVQESDFENTLYTCQVESGGQSAAAVFHFVRAESSANSRIATYSSSSYTLEVGKTRQLIVSQSSPVPGSQSWRSSNSTVAKIESSGTTSCTVRAVTTGTAKITCNYAYKIGSTSFRTTDTFNITVKESTAVTPQPSISVSPGSTTLEIGQSEVVKVSVSGGGITKITYPEKLVSVTSWTGGYRITALAAGEGAVVFWSGDYYSDYCYVTIVDGVTSGECGDNLSWNLENGTLTISGTGKMYDFPDQTAPWKLYRSTITSIQVEPGVTSIGDSAFCGCRAKSVVLPESVHTIGDYAFKGSYLQEIEMPSVTEIGTWAFAHCKLKSLQLPQGISSIKESTFECCYDLASMYVPDGVTSIGKSAFERDWGMTTIRLPVSLKYVGSSAFTNCSKLTTVNYGGSQAQWKAIVDDSNRLSSASLKVNYADTTDYSVLFNANQGNGAPADIVRDDRTEIVLPDTRPSRPGYRFLGWATSAKATEAEYHPGETCTVGEGTTLCLYAVWEEITYTVTYNANGGENAPQSQTKKEGVNLTLSKQEPTYEGFLFQGWAGNAGATTPEYQPGGLYTKDEDIELFAVWK